MQRAKSGGELMVRHLWWALGLLALMAAPFAAVAADARDPREHFFQSFLGDLQAELANARQAQKKGIVLVYEMEECPFCERLHGTVVNRGEVQEYYRRHFLIFRMDVRGGIPITDFDGKDVKESDFAAKSRVRATPTTVFYGLEGQELARFTGLPRDSGEYLQLGRYVVDGHYRSMPFSGYKRKVGQR